MRATKIAYEALVLLAWFALPWISGNAGMIHEAGLVRRTCGYGVWLVIGVYATMVIGRSWKPAAVEKSQGPLAEDRNEAK